MVHIMAAWRKDFWGTLARCPMHHRFKACWWSPHRATNETGGGMGACSGSQDSGGNLDEIWKVWKDFMCLLYLNVLSGWVLLCTRTTFFLSPGIRPVLAGYAKGFCSSPHYLIWNSIGDRISSAQEEINDVLEAEPWCQWFFVKSPAAMICE